MQNLTLSYAPNPVSTGSMKQGDSADELLYDARLDNNGMHYALRIKAINKGGRLDNDGNRIKVTSADEVVFIITADTDYKMNFDPDFNDPKTYRNRPARHHEEVARRCRRQDIRLPP